MCKGFSDRCYDGYFKLLSTTDVFKKYSYEDIATELVSARDEGILSPRRFDLLMGDLNFLIRKYTQQREKEKYLSALCIGFVR